jgi:hypothetical protein
MKHQTNISETSDSDLWEMFESARTMRPLPDDVRARARARALASLTAAAASPPSIEARHVRSLRLALTVALAFTGAVAVAAGAIAALRGRAPRASTPVPLFISDVAPPSLAAQADSPEAPPTPTAKPVLSSERRRAHSSFAARGAYSAELRLLRRAQVAYAGADFFSALVLMREHERRFPNAALAEERDALRVRSLAGAQRAAEARDAAEAFAHRFPHSVLLPSLRVIPKPSE